MHRGSIAYTVERGGSFDIWLYWPSSGLDYPLTHGLGELFSIPYWSPDARKIAFIGKGNIIYLLDTSTGSVAEIDLIEPYTLLDWSSDSRLLTYVRNGRIVIYNIVNHSSRTIFQTGATDAQWFPWTGELLFAAPDSAGISQLYKINADGTNKRQLTRNTNGPLHNVRLSPDGRFALYTSPGVSISIISSVDLATGNTYTLQGGPQAKNYFPEWSPDSLFIAYSATTLEQNKYYSLIQTDSRLGQNQRTWARSDCFATPVSWSPVGRRIAYLSGCGTEEQASQIWIVDLYNPVPSKVVEGGRIAALAWSPSPFTVPRFAIYTNEIYHVAFPYPAHWRKVTEERYESEDGFFQISAISSEDELGQVCHSEAFHPLRPYGSNPRVVRSYVQNQQACFIFPSSDQPKEMKNQSALILKYPRPVSIGGTTYQYFVLWADRNHILSLAKGFRFVAL